MRRTEGDLLLWDEHQLEVLEAAVSNARAGSPSLLLIEGPPGTGKSSLLDELSRRTSGFTVAWSEGDESQTTPKPFSGLRDWGVQVDSFDPTGDSSVTVAAGYLAQLVDERAATAPVLLVLDDAQWADQESVEATHFFLRQAEGTPLLVAIARRTDAVPATRDPVAALRDVHARLWTMGLTGLTSTQARTLASRQRPGVSSPAVRELWRHTDGNPLFLSSLLEEFSAEEIDDLPEHMSAPSAYVQVVERRLARVTPAARGVMAALTVLRAGWSALPDVAAVAELGDVVEVVQELVVAKLAVVTASVPVSVRPAHALVRAAVNQLLTPAERADLHRRAAQATSGLSALEHRIAATTRYDERLSAEVAVQAERLYYARDHRRAAHFYQAARALCPSAEGRRRLWLESLWNDILAGSPTSAPELAAIGTTGGDPAVQAVAGLLLMYSADLHTALRALEEVDPGLLAAADPVVRRRWGALAAYARLLTGESTEHVRQALDVAGPGGAEDSALQDFESPTRGFIAARGYQEGSMDAEFDWLPARAREVPAEYRYVLWWRAIYRLFALKVSEAVRDLETGLDRLGAEPDLTAGHRLLGLAYFLTGNWPLARVSFGLSAPVTGPASLWAPDISRHLLDSVSRLGTAAGPGLLASTSLARETPWPEGRLLLLVADVVRVHAAGVPPSAVADLAAAYSDLADLVEVVPPDDGLMLVHAGLLAVWCGWRAVLQQCLGKLTRCQRPSPSHPAIIAWLEGLMARSAHDDARAETLLARAAADDRNELPLYRAHMRADHAAAVAGTDPARSAEEQARAVAAYRRLGATPYAERLEAAQPFEPDAGALIPRLTDRERDVLALLVQGLSYKQIANRLFVTSSTVRYHLSNIYAKLDVSSRHDATAYTLDNPSVLSA
ncbi:MAG TPA: LuxR C-terminal-related transcriptional regulator [Streptosporangiaceae bacterium]|nr:LuxR C-terminal-related transcriptional regulator [Streptosporangiaceae bacterium]